jgi:hypothetical protein
VEAIERWIAGKIMFIKKYIAICFFCAILLGCGEWEGGNVGKVSCSFGSFNDFIPTGRTPTKIASGNNGNNLYILDKSYYVHTYKRDHLYECAFNLEFSDSFNGLPNDVISSGSNFYVQDRAQLKSYEDVEVCDAKDGVFALNGNELAVGSTAGIEIWNISTNGCVKKENVSSQKVLALAATNSEYFAVEGISTEPQSLARYPKNGGFAYRDIMSSTPGNEKNFCSADRVIANNHGVYLLDKKCKKIGVYDNQAVWRKTINLDSLGVRNILDIAPDEYQYIFLLHLNGVERISTM